MYYPNISPNFIPRLFEDVASFIYIINVITAMCLDVFFFNILFVSPEYNRFIAFSKKYVISFNISEEILGLYTEM